MSKSRNFAFVLYPESVNSNWKRILTDLNQPCFYILHDKDTVIDKNTGEVVQKKPHYHVMIMFSTPRSDNTAKKISIMCGGNGHLETLISKRGYARYLCHIDDEFKYKYDYNKVCSVNGANYTDCIATDAEMVDKNNDLLAEIIKYCNDNNIIAYCQIVDYCIANRRDWLPIIRKNSHMICAYVKSKFWYNSYC